MLITFRLTGIWDSGRIYLNDKELLPNDSWKVHVHSHDGFSWGYNGSGPSQLALAICLELKLKTHYQDFKNTVIARLPQSDFDSEIKFQDHD